MPPPHVYKLILASPMTVRLMAQIDVSRLTFASSLTQRFLFSWAILKLSQEI